MPVPLADATVLLTGASGFLGRHCYARLAALGARLHAVSRSGAGRTDERVNWHAADLRDPAATTQLVSSIRPTHLLHIAWIATPGVFWHAAENVDWLTAGLALLRAFGDCGGRRFVGVGSCAEYDWHSDHFIEDETPIRPAMLYGKAKAAMWAAAETCAAHYGFTAAWGRVFLPYGPGEPAEKLIPSIIDRLREGRPVRLTGGTQERDFIYAPDVADLLVRLLEADVRGAFNVATGHGTTVRRTAEYIADRIEGGRALLEFGARLPAVEQPPSLVADMTKVAAQLGAHAATPVAAGLDALLAAAGFPAAAPSAPVFLEV